MESLKKMFFKQEISMEDLSYISKLLKTNLSLRQTLELLKNKSNAKIFNKIIKALDEGQMIETIIGEYLPSQIEGYMLPLL